MGWCIVKEPSGRLAIWSSRVDDFIARGCSPEEVEAIYRWDACEKVRRDLREEIDEVERDVRIGFGPHTFAECIAAIEAVHGPDRAAEEEAFIPDDDPPPATPASALARVLFAGGEKQEAEAGTIIAALRSLGYDVVPASAAPQAGV